MALAGRGIVVTRPREQAGGLCALIEHAGGRAIRFPTLEIAPLADPSPAYRAIDALDAQDLAVFVSANAVRYAFSLIAARRPGWRWPASLRAAAVGSGTGEALRAAGVAEVLLPQECADSEGLLALPALQAVCGRRIVIFRGQGGRPVLGDTLRQRGAAVSYAECYRRRMPQPDAAPLLACWRQRRIDAITVSSAEGLENLCRLLGEAGAQLLRGTPVFAPHRRIAERGRSLGLQTLCVSGPGDAEMLRALVAYFASGK